MARQSQRTQLATPSHVTNTRRCIDQTLNDCPSAKTFYLDASSKLTERVRNISEICEKRQPEHSALALTMRQMLSLAAAPHSPSLAGAGGDEDGCLTAKSNLARRQSGGSPEIGGDVITTCNATRSLTHGERRLPARKGQDPPQVDGVFVES